MTEIGAILDQSLEVLAKLPDSTGLNRCAYFFQLATLLTQAKNLASATKNEEKNQND